MKNKKLALLISGVTLLTLSIVCATNINFSFDKGNNKTNADNTRGVTSVNASSLRLDNGYSASITSDGYVNEDLFALDGYGYIQNSQPIRGITAINVSYQGSSPWAKIVPCYYDYETDAVVPTNEEWPATATSMDFRL